VNEKEIMMNEQNCTVTKKGWGSPLYASPWLALFVVLRREFRLARQS
jgi:hypothetical protein